MKLLQHAGHSSQWTAGRGVRSSSRAAGTAGGLQGQGGEGSERTAAASRAASFSSAARAASASAATRADACSANTGPSSPAVLVCRPMGAAQSRWDGTCAPNSTVCALREGGREYRRYTRLACAATGGGAELRGGGGGAETWLTEPALFVFKAGDPPRWCAHAAQNTVNDAATTRRCEGAAQPPLHRVTRC